MADSDQERTEAPTAKRREDFREKGQVAQSKEVTTAALMTVSLLLWVFYAKPFWFDLRTMMRSFLVTLPQFEATPASVIHLLWQLTVLLAHLLWPVFALTFLVGFFSSFFQVGPLLTFKVFELDPNKFNPIQGMSKFVSKRAAIELVKSLSKVILIGYVAYQTVSNEFSTALTLVSLDLRQTIVFLAKVAYLVMAKTCGIMIVLAIIDYVFTKYEMEQKMKMTKEEVKEEHKQQEGDPKVKGRIRSVQREMARRRMMAEVPKADVVITNPTHLSVAVSYDREQMAAPQVVAKGADHLAMRIREIAREHHVPILENKPVARALYKLEVGDQIPEDLFKAVAEVLAYVYRLKKK